MTHPSSARNDVNEPSRPQVVSSNAQKTAFFRRYGNSYHAVIETFDDLLTVARTVPETQWIAVAAPIEGLSCDSRFLQYLDTDGNRRILVNELRRAVLKVATLLDDTRGVDTHSDCLELSHLSAHQDAVRIKEAAQLLANAAAATPEMQVIPSNTYTRISLDELQRGRRALYERGYTGDGILLPAQVPDVHLQKLVASIIALYPAVHSLAGTDGLSVSLLERFMDERASLQHLVVHQPASLQDSTRTAETKQIVEFSDMIDTYFSMLSLRHHVAISKNSLTADPFRLLPASADWTSIAIALLSRYGIDLDVVDENQQKWQAIRDQARADLDWQRRWQEHPLVKHLWVLSVNDADLTKLSQLQQEDLSRKPILDAVDALEELVLCQQWLLYFSNSFITMPRLYKHSPYKGVIADKSTDQNTNKNTNKSTDQNIKIHESALEPLHVEDHALLFDRGMLVLAGRRYLMPVYVPNLDESIKMTSQGTTCMIYARVFDQQQKSLFDVAAPKTKGWSGEIYVGKRGLFYDHAGKEYDATVVHIVYHPVTLWEAALSPFLRIGGLITKKLEALISSGEENFSKNLDAELGKASTAPTAPTAPIAPPNPNSANMLGSSLAAGGVAIAAVGSSLAFVISQVKAMSFFDVVSSILSVAALVALPSGLLGYLKLNRRNVAQLLEGSGWALNDRLPMSNRLASLMTQRPPLPQKQKIIESIIDDMDDGSDRLPWRWRLLLLVLLLFTVFMQAYRPASQALCSLKVLPQPMCVAFGAFNPPDAAPAPSSAPVPTPTPTPSSSPASSR